MGNFKSLFKKNPLAKKATAEEAYTSDHDLISEVKNWYSDRYELLLVQRNILFLFVVLSVFSIITGVFALGKIASSKTIEPFIVEIENKTGITNIVNPIPRKDLTTDEALNTYFLLIFLRGRETYNAVDFEYNYKTVMRLLCAPNIYNEFRYYINSNPKSPVNVYGKNNSTTLKVRSLQFLESHKAQIRFTITETSGNKLNYNKIATVTFEYQQMELTSEERQVNPLGFQITSYRVDDENL